MSAKNLVMLVILDGYGLNNQIEGNAVYQAKKPHLDQIFSQYPYTTLEASGEAVGLPAGQMGNSEVGHLNIGAGRVVYQSLTKVDIAVRDKTLDKMPAIDEAINQAIKKETALHIMGLMSDGGVHSHINHIIYLMNTAKKRGVKKIFIHAFLDGRDVPPKSAITYLEQLQVALSDGIEVGVVSGRYYAMDRDKNYNRIQVAYDALVRGVAPVKDLIGGIRESYQEGVIDEFVLPYLVNQQAVIKDGDSIIFANFRPDRAIQMSLALTNPSETSISNPIVFNDLTYVQMMLYSDKVKGKVNFELQELENMYGDVIAQNNLRQLRIAETEKYAHVTYFFDGGIDKEIVGADRILIASPKVETYDLLPEMSAYEVTDKVLTAINSGKYDTIILNYANCDMVGHTAVLPATIKAVETVDACVGKIYEAVKSVGGTMIITADHGNADKVIDELGQPFSAHTTNPVPLCITKKGLVLRQGGNLGDIAPTMLDLLGVDQPCQMLGKTLIKN